MCGLAIVAAAWTLTSGIAGKWIGMRPTAPLLLTAGGGWFALTVLDWLRRLATS
jgi:hypothetical protein